MSSPTQTPVHAPGSASAEESNLPWLVMVYMAGDNSLTEEMVLALQDLMLEGAPNGDIVVAQFDPSGTGVSTQRFDFTKAPGEPHLEDYRYPAFDGLETNTGSPETLKSFVRWAGR